jgi:hypothetical protein
LFEVGSLNIRITNGKLSEEFDFLSSTVGVYSFLPHVVTGIAGRYFRLQIKKRTMTFNSILFAWLMLIQEAPVFVAETIDANLQIGYGLAVGDVDGDKKPDILLADKKQFVWYRNGDWKRFVMVDNLTASDNVCIAARDIDGDGKVEVAVGAQWNPGETSDTTTSGSVHFLIRPSDPTKPWRPVKLHHEVTIHRMKWVKSADRKFQLVVLPLHGYGNKEGVGADVKIIVFDVPSTYATKWKHTILDSEMHMTHNLDVVTRGTQENFYVGGKEGIKLFSNKAGKWISQWKVQSHSFGEIREGSLKGVDFIAGIEPIHGNVLAVYVDGQRTELANGLKQGHALATADLLRKGNDQIVVGWREPDVNGKTGIRLFTFENQKWIHYSIDETEMACEDLVVADLDGDGNKDIIAAGRASHNLKIYWNKN